MEIKRINTYDDKRFSTHVLMQHGCFLINDVPYEVEIISNYEAIVKGDNRDYYLPLIEEFRFYTPHITKFYDDDKNIIIEYPKENIIEIELKNIQPSQFYVDRKKLSMIQEFIHEEKDIIIANNNGTTVNTESKTAIIEKTKFVVGLIFLTICPPANLSF